MFERDLKSVKPNLYDLSHAEITALIAGWGQLPYRAKQIIEWLYKHKVTDFEQMKTLPKPLREKLAEATTIGVLEPAAEQFSIDGQTVKRLFKLPDGQLIES